MFNLCEINDCFDDYIFLFKHSYKLKCTCNAEIKYDLELNFVLFHTSVSIAKLVSMKHMKLTKDQ